MSMIYISLYSRPWKVVLAQQPAGDRRLASRNIVARSVTSVVFFYTLQDFMISVVGTAPCISVGSMIGGLIAVG